MSDKPPDVTHAEMMSSDRCSNCDGTGKVHSHNPECWECGGSGKTPRAVIAEPICGCGHRKSLHFVDGDRSNYCQIAEVRFRAIDAEAELAALQRDQVALRELAERVFKRGRDVSYVEGTGDASDFLKCGWCGSTWRIEEAHNQACVWLLAKTLHERQLTACREEPKP